MSPKQDQSTSTVNSANVRGASTGHAASLSIFLLLLVVCHGEFELHQNNDNLLATASKTLQKNNTKYHMRDSV